MLKIGYPPGIVKPMERIHPLETTPTPMWIGIVRYNTDRTVAGRSNCGRYEMQFGRALTFAFRDDDWFKKVFVPAACLWIPLLGVLSATGWALEVCRREIRRQTPALPAMEFRRNLADGLAVWGIFWIFGIPLFLWVGAGGILGSASETPLASIGVLDWYWWMVECGALAVLAATAVWLIAAIGRFAASGSFRAAFQLREIFFAIRSAPAAFLLAALAWIPLGLLAVSGAAICCVGGWFTSAFAAASAFHLAGQACALAASPRVVPVDSPAS
jgi:hypothetical protein